LHEQDVAGNLNTNISIQRNEVWNPVMKSNFIVSLLLDIPIESLLFEKTADDKYNVLDGKQRTLTLCSFVKDEFVLSPKIEMPEIGGVQLAKNSFLNLPEKLRSKILSYQLTFAVMDELTEEQRAQVFYMRNQSVHLSKMDLSRVVLGKRSRDILTLLCGHPFLQEKIAMSTRARRNRDDLKVVLQFMILKMKPETGFSAKEVMDFCAELKDSKSLKIPEKEIKNTFDFLDIAFEEKNPILKKIHLPSILWLAEIAKNNKISSKEFFKRTVEFFDSLTPEHPYSIACQGGRSKRPDVSARLKAMSIILQDRNIKEILALQK
jgi:hypothetical protein